MNNEIPRGEHLVLCQKWEESERGWGVRPDGFSLHVSRFALQEYLRRDREEKAKTNYIPDEYSRPNGDAYGADVSDEVYEEIRVEGGSKRYWNNYRKPDMSIIERGR